MTSYYQQIVTIFGRRPEVVVYSPTEYRVTFAGWHMHSGAATSRPFASGTTLENACKRLAQIVKDPQVMVVEGEDCDYQCHARYMKSESHQKASHHSLRTVIAEAAAMVDKWPAWKRNLPPCIDERCEREADHKGKHRRAKPIEFEEWS